MVKNISMSLWAKKVLHAAKKALSVRKYKLCLLDPPPPEPSKSETNLSTYDLDDPIGYFSSVFWLLSRPYYLHGAILDRAFTFDTLG